MEITESDQKRILWEANDSCIITFKEEDSHYIVKVRYNRSLSNCKLVYLEDIRNLNYLVKIENKIKALEYIFTLHAQVQMVYLNTNNEDLCKLIKDNFDVLTCSEIPLGYSHGLIQYHMMVRNTGFSEDWKETQKDYDDNLKDYGIKIESKYLKHEK